MTLVSNIDAGEFDQRVGFERKVDPPPRGPKGELVDAWVPLITTGDGCVWARVDAIRRAKETFADASLHSVSDYTFWIRAEVFVALQLTANDRAVWNGRFFDIKNIEDQQRRGRKIAITVSGGMNQG